MEGLSAESLTTCNNRSFENDGLSPEGEARDGEARDGEARDGDITEGESTDGEARDGEVLAPALLFLDCLVGLNMRPRRPLVVGPADDRPCTTALDLIDKQTPKRKSCRVLKAIMAAVSLLHDVLFVLLKLCHHCDRAAPLESDASNRAKFSVD